MEPPSPFDEDRSLIPPAPIVSSWNSWGGRVYDYKIRIAVRQSQWSYQTRLRGFLKARKLELKIERRRKREEAAARKPRRTEGVCRSGHEMTLVCVDPNDTKIFRCYQCGARKRRSRVYEIRLMDLSKLFRDKPNYNGSEDSPGFHNVVRAIEDRDTL